MVKKKIKKRGKSEKGRFRRYVKENKRGKRIRSDRKRRTLKEE